MKAFNWCPDEWFTRSDYNHISQYLIPILLDFNASTLRETYAAAETVRDNVKVELLIVWYEGLDNESCNGSLTPTHLYLLMNTETVSLKIRFYMDASLSLKWTVWKKGRHTSLPRRSFTKTATWAKSRFKATRPLFPRLPNNMSGFTTNFSEESQGSLSTSSLKSVDSVTWHEGDFINTEILVRAFSLSRLYCL